MRKSLAIAIVRSWCAKSPIYTHLKRGSLWAWRSSRKRTRQSQAPIKLAQPFPALELRAEKLRTFGVFFPDFTSSLALFHLNLNSFQLLFFTSFQPLHGRQSQTTVWKPRLTDPWKASSLQGHQANILLASDNRRDPQGTRLTGDNIRISVGALCSLAHRNRSDFCDLRLR